MHSDRANCGQGARRRGPGWLLLLLPAALASDGALSGAKAARPPASRAIDRWSPYIAEASARFGIPRQWIGRVMHAESGGRTRIHGRPITSRSGAMGLMQLMPGTWAEMRALHGLGPDPHDPRDNILAGAAYLRAMYDRFGYPGLFAAYHAGPGRYAGHLATGRELPAETIAYVSAVGSPSAAPAASFRGQAPASGLFVSLANPARPSAAIGVPGAGGDIFIRLSKVSPAPE